MSRGTPPVSVRIPPDVLAAVDAAIKSANDSRVEAPYDRTGWILAAIRQKLAHVARGRRRRKSVL